MSYSQNSVSVFHLFIKNLIMFFLFENFDTLYSSEVYSAINKLILNWVKSWEAFCLMSLKKKYTWHTSGKKYGLFILLSVLFTNKNIFL